MFELAFYLLLVLLLGSLTLFYRQALRRAGRSPVAILRNTRIAVAGMSVWVLYVSALSYTGIFRVFTPPPRIVLLLILPAFTWMLWFFRSGRYRVLMQHIPVWQLPALQGFRIVVELLIWGITLRGLGPEMLSFEGRNFDVIAGLTGPVVAWFLFRYGARFHKLAVYWNILGLALLVNVVFMFISLALRPQMWGFSEIPMKPEFGAMPYMLIAAVYMPAAVFMHMLSLHQLAFSRTKAQAKVQVVHE